MWPYNHGIMDVMWNVTIREESNRSVGRMSHLHSSFIFPTLSKAHTYWKHSANIPISSISPPPTWRNFHLPNEKKKNIAWCCSLLRPPWRGCSLHRHRPRPCGQLLGQCRGTGRGGFGGDHGRRRRGRRRHGHRGRRLGVGGRVGRVRGRVGILHLFGARGRHPFWTDQGPGPRFLPGPVKWSEKWLQGKWKRNIGVLGWL